MCQSGELWELSPNNLRREDQCKEQKSLNKKKWKLVWYKGCAHEETDSHHAVFY